MIGSLTENLLIAKGHIDESVYAVDKKNLKFCKILEAMKEKLIVIDDDDDDTLTVKLPPRLMRRMITFQQ